MNNEEYTLKRAKSRTSRTLFDAYESKKTLEQVNKHLVLKVFPGSKARYYWKQIADIRITLLKKFPYLYSGSLSDEKEYLEIYFRSLDSRILLLFDGKKVVGFSSIIPLNQEMSQIQHPFQEKEIDISCYLYIGELMLLPSYRGMGVLRAFFKHHEEYAQQNGYRHIVFMTVNRPSMHSLRPQDYRDLEPVWEHFGYTCINGIEVTMPWMRIDTNKETENTLSVWIKTIAS